MLDKLFLQNDTTNCSYRMTLHSYQKTSRRNSYVRIYGRFYGRGKSRYTTAVKLELFAVYRVKMESERSEYWLSDRLVLNIAPDSVLLRTVAV